MDIKSKKSSDYLTWGGFDSIYKADIEEIGAKLFEAAVARERTETHLTVMILIMVGMIIVPAGIFGVKRYLKSASNKQRSKDIEQAAPVAYRRIAAEPGVIIPPLSHLPRVDQPLAVHHSVSVARNTERMPGGSGSNINSIESGNDT